MSEMVRESQGDSDLPVRISANSFNLRTARYYRHNPETSTFVTIAESLRTEAQASGMSKLGIEIASLRGKLKAADNAYNESDARKYARLLNNLEGKA